MESSYCCTYRDVSVTKGIILPKDERDSWQVTRTLDYVTSRKAISLGGMLDVTITKCCAALSVRQ